MSSILQGEIDFYGALERLPQVPYQRELISCAEPHAALVGGQGAGKTLPLMMSSIINAKTDPHGYSLVGRLHMPALETTTLRTFLELMPEDFGTWQPSKKIFTFHNGHEVIFKHLDISDPKIVGHIRSLNLSWVYVDEGTEIAEETYFLLIGRLRRKTSKRRGIKIASNPAGHDWLWRHFFDPERKDEWKAINRGITASTLDNPFLDQQYVQNMLATYPEDWAQRFIYGSFSDFSDLVYKEFTEKTHTWNPKSNYAFFQGSGNPPHEWPVIIGIDIGSDLDPWSAVLISVCPDGRLFQYAEVYSNTMLIGGIANAITAKLDGRKVMGIAYDSANRTAGLELGEYGISGSPANKEVKPGLFKAGQYFHIDPRYEHPFLGSSGSPWFFLSTECRDSIRELGEYKWPSNSGSISLQDEKDEILPLHKGSHSNDARRYAIHTFRPAPEKQAKPKIWQNAALTPESREYWKSIETEKDRMKGFVPREKPFKSWQEWQKTAGERPRRFQRPTSARFSRY